jgi:hypothetical protein
VLVIAKASCTSKVRNQLDVVSFEEVTECDLQSVRCKKCRTYYRGNFARLVNTGKKVNTLSFKQMEELDTYFVTPALGFKITYLRRLMLSLEYARTVPGQEANVALEFLNEVVGCKLDLSGISLRDHLLHALEGLGVAMRGAGACIPYDVEYPAALQFSDRDVMKFSHHSKPVTHLVFDGHFGVNRMLEKGVDVCTKQKIEKPRKVKKSRTLYEYIRSARCAHKNKVRATLPDRTGGWQFVCDGRTGEVLTGYEHINNEVNKDKHVASAGAHEHAQSEATWLMP